MIPEVCDKCANLRGAEIATPLEMCEDRFACLKIRLCEYHCYEMFDMCSICLNFIQDPKNDKQLHEWESRNGKS